VSWAPGSCAGRRSATGPRCSRGGALVLAAAAAPAAAPAAAVKQTD
jgi:hypothetical protein